MSEIDIATSLLDEYSDAKIQELIDLRPWMKDKTFRLLHEHAEIEQYIDQCIEKNICALDLETTSLNTRRDADGNSIARIVGICMALDPDEGVYIPVGHRDKDYNVSERFIISQLKRLTSNCVCVYHNFKYDGQVLYNYGIVIEDYRMIEDTMVMSAIEDAGRKTKALKPLSEHLLKRPMIEIADLGIQGLRKAVVAFDMVPPQNALYYGAPDAMNTLLLYQYFKQKIDEQDPTGKAGPWIVYGIEKRCIFVTMEMERNLAKIDRGYFQELRNRVQKNIENTKSAVFEMIGHEFDLNSPKQVGPILFEEQKIPYPEKQKTASGQYETSEAVLEKLDKYPVVALILKYRKLTKVQGTYIDNFLKNADENDEVKFQLNQVRADTGRYTATGGKGLEVDGYCGVNCQNIPKPDEKDPEVIDLRKGIIARPGYKILSIDYSGEELRIAANFSREPKWIKEFKEGTGDIHSITARIIYGREEISKKERAIGKRLNFLTLYKGGAGGFSTAAKIPYETARRMLINFFRDYKGLKNWMDREIRICRKRGYSKTVFGRRRPLQKFYATSDKQIQAKGDRCAINSSIQGSGADIIKVALYKVWKWIRDNDLQDDVKILMPIHDEIVFEIKEDKLEILTPEICKVMTLGPTIESLGWEIPLEVDAEYGDSFHVDHDFWEDFSASSEKEEVEEKLPETNPVEQRQENNGHEEALEVNNDNGNGKESLEPVPKERENNDSGGTDRIYDTTYNEGPQVYCTVTVNDGIKMKLTPEEQAKAALQKSDNGGSECLVENIKTKEHLDKEGYFNYALEMDQATARRLRFIFETLTSVGKETFVGPKYKMCLLNRNGEVIYKTSEKYPVDAFLALCLSFNV